MKGFSLMIHKLPSRETFWIHVEPLYRISECKQKIERMRGIPASSIRFTSKENSRIVDPGSDGDFQDQTLESLGIRSEGNINNEGPCLEIAPMSLCVQTPNGKQIVLKDCIDVEDTVDRIEELLDSGLKSMNIISDPFRERFRLYHNTMPMLRGNNITKHKIKDMDVLTLKLFRVDEKETHQKEEKRNTFRSSEVYQKIKVDRFKVLRKSDSVQNLRPRSLSDISNSSNKKHHRSACSLSPVRNWTSTKPRYQKLEEESQSEEISFQQDAEKEVLRNELKQAQKERDALLKTVEMQKGELERANSVTLVPSTVATGSSEIVSSEFTVESDYCAILSPEQRRKLKSKRNGTSLDRYIVTGSGAISMENKTCAVSNPETRRRKMKSVRSLFSRPNRRKMIRSASHSPTRTVSDSTNQTLRLQLFEKDAELESLRAMLDDSLRKLDDSLKINNYEVETACSSESQQIQVEKLRKALEEKDRHLESLRKSTEAETKALEKKLKEQSEQHEELEGLKETVNAREKELKTLRKKLKSRSSLERRKIKSMRNLLSKPPKKKIRKMKRSASWSPEKGAKAEFAKNEGHPLRGFSDHEQPLRRRLKSHSPVRKAKTTKSRTRSRSTGSKKLQRDWFGKSWEEISKRGSDNSSLKRKKKAPEKNKTTGKTAERRSSNSSSVMKKVKAREENAESIRKKVHEKNINQRKKEIYDSSELGSSEKNQGNQGAAERRGRSSSKKKKTKEKSAEGTNTSRSNEKSKEKGRNVKRRSSTSKKGRGDSAKRRSRSSGKVKSKKSYGKAGEEVITKTVNGRAANKRSRSRTKKNSSAIYRAWRNEDCALDKGKKSSDEAHPRKSRKRRPKETIPDVWLRLQKRDAKQQGAPTSPVSAFVETVNSALLLEDCSEGCTDIQSQETDSSILSEETNNQTFSDAEFTSDFDEDAASGIINSNRSGLRECTDCTDKNSAEAIPLPKLDTGSSVGFYVFEDVTATADRDRTTAQEAKENTSRRKGKPTVPKIIPNEIVIDASSTKQDITKVVSDATRSTSKSKEEHHGHIYIEEHSELDASQSHRSNHQAMVAELMHFLEVHLKKTTRLDSSRRRNSSMNNSTTSDTKPNHPRKPKSKERRRASMPVRIEKNSPSSQDRVTFEKQLAPQMISPKQRKKAKKLTGSIEKDSIKPKVEMAN